MYRRLSIKHGLVGQFSDHEGLERYEVIVFTDSCTTLRDLPIRDIDIRFSDLGTITYSVKRMSSIPAQASKPKAEKSLLDHSTIKKIVLVQVWVWCRSH